MGLILIVLGIGALCVLLFNFAVYALPAFVGFSAFFWALHSGAGIGSPVVGLIAGVTVFILGQAALTSHHAWLRLSVVALFVIPAIYAGYSMVLQLAGLGAIPSPLWQQVFAVFGGIAVGGTTLARLAGPMEFGHQSQA